MSLYDWRGKISTVARTAHIPRYGKDYVVAVFYKNSKPIKMYFEHYTKNNLRKEMEKNYDAVHVDINFFDTDFCTHQNIMQKDINEVKERLGIKGDEDMSRAVVGYIISLLTIHRLIYKTYADNTFDPMKLEIAFDKNMMMVLFSEFDMVINFNQKLIDFINSVFSEERKYDFLVTPSGKFRFIEQDIKYFLDGTKRPHEVSSTIVQTVFDVETILRLHLELVKVCDTIYSPSLITSIQASNILLNLLKLNIDMDKHERLLFKIIDHYVDKGGSLDIVFDIKTKFDRAIPILDAIKEYRLSSHSGSF